MKCIKNFFIKAPKEIEEQATDYDKGFRDGAMFIVCIFLLFALIKVIFDFI